MINLENQPVTTIIKDLNQALATMGYGQEGSFSYILASEKKMLDKARWPSSWKGVVVNVITGTSEGHYIHVGVWTDEDGLLHTPMMYVKVFSGRDRAWDMAKATAEVLGA